MPRDLGRSPLPVSPQPPQRLDRLEGDRPAGARAPVSARSCGRKPRLSSARIPASCSHLASESLSLMPRPIGAASASASAPQWAQRAFVQKERRGLADCSSAPRQVPSRLPADRLEAIEALRRLRMTAAEIAEVPRMALSTVSRWLARIGLGKRSRLEPPEPPNRYERKRPGEADPRRHQEAGAISTKGAGHRVLGMGSARASSSEERAALAKA